MKKIFIYFFIVMAAVSCRLDMGGGSHRTPDAVTLYTSRTMYDWVVNTASFMDLALEIDEYVSLSEEERKDARYDHLRQNLRRIDGNTLSYDYSIVIYTDGRLNDAGSVWRFEVKREYLTYYLMQNYGICPENAMSDGDYAVDWVMENTGADSWRITVNEPYMVNMTADFKVSGRLVEPDSEYPGTGNEYLAVVDGRTAGDEDGFSCTFSTDDFRYSYGSVSDDGDSSEGEGTVKYYRTYTGGFRLDVYNGNDLKDWCEMRCTSSGTDFRTSLDAI